VLGNAPLPPVIGVAICARWPNLNGDENISPITTNACDVGSNRYLFSKGRRKYLSIEANARL